MMILMNSEVSQRDLSRVVEKAERMGMGAHLLRSEGRLAVCLTGEPPPEAGDQLKTFPGVIQVSPITKAYKLASREFNPGKTRISIGGVQVGGPEILIIAGPCSVESRSQLLETAWAVREAGAAALRGGAYKPRTSPYSFQGLGEAGLEILAEAREQTGLPIVTEVMSPELVPMVARWADVLQIGSRNMQNYPLLRAAGESDRPVLLKRGLSATLDEFLMAAEHILSRGNGRVILCERGIRSFETSTRNTTDINALPVLGKLTHLPVLLDPSHSTGKWEYVTPIALAGIAAGADGLIIEVHPTPSEALSDGSQSLRPERFADLVNRVRAVAEAVGRRLPLNACPPFEPAPLAVGEPAAAAEQLSGNS